MSLDRFEGIWQTLGIFSNYASWSQKGKRMYGLVNQAVRGLVLDNYGEEAWDKIRIKADAPESFVSMQPYDDAVTYGLVGAAVEVLDLPAEKILYVFGEYWVHKIAAVSYAELMSTSGTDFVDFVKNLDHMHSRIKVTFPDYSPPSFRVKEISEGSIQLDYYSKREGLLPFVEGLMNGVAAHFGSEITIAHVDDAINPMPSKRMIVNHKRIEG